MKCLKYFLHRALGLLVGLFPILALADEFKWSHMVGVFTPPATDRSMAFLAQIFGGVGSGLAAGGSTIMGEIFGVFNAGLLVVTGVVLTYITIRSITDTAMDGEAMGKKLSHWTAVRVALSVVILVPGPSGYSLINSVVMWFTVQGVGFADTIWSHSLDYLKNGGVIYRQVLNTNRPEVASGLLDQILVIGDKKPSATTTSVSPSQNKAGASDIFRSMVCMHVLDRNIGAMREKVEKDINDDVNRVNKYYPKDQQMNCCAMCAPISIYIQILQVVFLRQIQEIHNMERLPQRYLFREMVYTTRRQIKKSLFTF